MCARRRRLRRLGRTARTGRTGQRGAGRPRRRNLGPEPMVQDPAQRPRILGPSLPGARPEPGAAPIRRRLAANPAADPASVRRARVDHLTALAAAAVRRVVEVAGGHADAVGIAPLHWPAQAAGAGQVPDAPARHGHSRRQDPARRAAADVSRGEPGHDGGRRSCRSRRPRRPGGAQKVLVTLNLAERGSSGWTCMPATPAAGSPGRREV